MNYDAETEQEDEMNYNVHELNGNVYGKIINSFASDYFARQFADNQKKATGKDYVVIRGSMIATYTTEK